MGKKRVALIGYGALGKILAQGIREELFNEYEISGIWDLFIDAMKDQILADGFPICESVDQILADKPDYVVEIASVHAVRDHGEKVLAQGIPLVVVSIGALADDELYGRLQKTAAENGTKMYLVSGAVGGFDVLQTIRIMGNAKGRIENFKAPDSLNGAPYLEGRTLSEDKIEKVFEGTAKEAIAGFPKNVNVAVSSALASVGVDKMEVLIESRPGLEDNVHKIIVENDTVKATVEIISKPDPLNPRSSTMTAWSVVALLRNLASPVEFF